MLEFKFNPFAIPPLSTAFILFAIAIIVLKKSHLKKAKITFVLFCLSMVIWLLGFCGMYLSPNEHTALLRARIGFIGITFIPILAYHFILSFIGSKRRLLLILLYLSTIPTIILSRTNYVYNGIATYFWGYYPTAGNLYFVFMGIFFSVFTWGVILLFLEFIKSKKKNEPVKTQQIKYVLMAFAGGTTGVIDYLVKYRIPVYPYGYISALAFISLIAYAIVKYRLMDITLIFRGGLVFLSYMIVVLGVSIPAAFLFKNLFAVTMVILVLLAASTPFIYQYLKNRSLPIIDSLLFKGKYDYLDKLEKFIEKMAFIPGEQDLLGSTVKTLTETLGVKKSAIFTLDNISSGYRLRKQEGLNEVEEFEIPNDNGIVSWLEKHKEVFVKEEMQQVLSYNELTPIKEILGKLGISVCVPVILKENLMGIITLGEKSSGEMYSHIDLKILHRFGTMLALSLNHIWTVAELQKERQQAEITKNRLNAITTMSHGLADRIRNDLQGIHAFIGDLPEKIKESKEKLPASVIESLENHYKASQGGVDKLIKLAIEIASICKPMSKNPQRYDPKIIIELADEAEKELESEMQNKEIRIEKVITGAPPAVYFDKEAIKRVLWNLIQNSIHAIPDVRKGLIKITVTGPVKRNEIEFLRIIIEDNGVGIPDENLENIFNPFYTTKGTAGGLGLGLTICQFIVNQHDGIIEVEHKELEKGTAIYVDLPVKTESPKPTIDYKDILGQFPARRVK